ncbi:hypothetical protein ACQEVC_12965 [Plantactinospora sp. CA-294935]|uniref:hypothetical protein n=1 Tax=Plantactinospora sp. CA-294935 TaxID=3240012 RepID=UPI003D8D3004
MVLPTHRLVTAVAAVSLAACGPTGAAEQSTPDCPMTASRDRKDAGYDNALIARAAGVVIATL